jgi:hypothetical protein
MEVDRLIQRVDTKTELMRGELHHRRVVTIEALAVVALFT